MNTDKQAIVDNIIDLLTKFDEMGFQPTTTVPNPEAYAIKWRDELTKALIDYRKQSVGEWRPSDYLYDDDGKWYRRSCSLCGWTTEGYWRDVRDIKYKFCPNCGAKMKGGE